MKRGKHKKEREKWMALFIIGLKKYCHHSYKESGRGGAEATCGNAELGEFEFNIGTFVFHGNKL